MFKTNAGSIAKISLPLALAGVGQASGFFFDSLFLARLGPEILAAGALVGWSFTSFAVFLFGTLNAINILVSYSYGAKDEQNIALVTRDGLWLACLLALIGIVLFWNLPALFLRFGQNPAVILLATMYFHSLVWGCLPFFMTVALLDVLLGVGRANLLLVFGLISVVLKIVSSYVLIFGKFGWPKLGIAGVGWGMSFSAWMTFILLVIYIIFQKRYHHYFIYLFKPTAKTHLVKLLQIGTPLGFMYCVEMGFFFALSLCIGSYGSQFLAANQVVMQYFGLLMHVVFAIAQAITVRIGYLLGAECLEEVKDAAYAGISISVAFMAVVAFIYWAYPKTLIAIDFDPNAPKNSIIVAYSIKILAVCAIFQILEALRVSLFGVLRAFQDTRFTLWVSILCFWGIALPLGYLLAAHHPYGVIGFWWGLIFSAVFNIFLFGWRFYSKFKDSEQFKNAIIKLN